MSIYSDYSLGYLTDEEFRAAARRERDDYDEYDDDEFEEDEEQYEE